jgi:hypothetical protein
MGVIVRNEALTVDGTAVNVSTPLKTAQRQVLSLRNSSAAGQVISVSYSDTQIAVVNNGIVLAAGQSIIDATSEGYECWQGSVSAISSAAGGVLSIMERVIT